MDAYALVKSIVYVFQDEPNQQKFEAFRNKWSSISSEKLAMWLSEERRTVNSD